MVGYPKNCFKIQTNQLENTNVLNMGVNLDTFAGVWTDFCKIQLKKSYKGSLTDYIDRLAKII